MEKFKFDKIQPKYKKLTKDNIKELRKALRTKDEQYIRGTFVKIFKTPCVDNLYNICENCFYMSCSQCRRKFIKDINEQLGYKNNLDWE